MSEGEQERGARQENEAPEDNVPLDGRTGQCHEYRIARPTAEIRSDFDHKRRITLEDTESGASYEWAHRVRDRRTGSILLPVLNSACVEGDREGYYLTPVHICPSTPRGPEPGDELVLELDHKDHTKRVEGIQHVAGMVEGGRVIHAPFRVKANWSRERFTMIANTLPGDPRRPGPAPVDQPSPKAPPESPHETIRPGEVWVRLRHRHDGDEAWQTDDRALFQIAPLLLQSNLEPARRLYVVSTRETHNFVYDVMEACWTAFGVSGTFDRDFGRPFPASTPDSIGKPPPPSEKRLSSDKMYLIDGNMYLGEHGPDVWIQDQMAIGYCSAPGGRAFNVVMHCKRDSRLAGFVRREMPNKEDRVFTFDGLSGPGPGTHPEEDGTDYGGNIAVSPPVPKKTNAQNVSRAGPRVPAHPPASHGKIVLGDCRNPRRPGKGVVHEETRCFLQSQGMQPIIPIDTSWLAIGHVDEILSFVPSPKSDGPAKLAMASPRVMTLLLEETMKVSLEEGRTHLHRGRHTEHFQLIDRIIEGTSGVLESEYEAFKRWFNESYDEASAEDLCRGMARKVSNTLRKRFLEPIEYRICSCTGLNRKKDVLLLPVYFTHLKDKALSLWGDALATARTPNLVNMQVLRTNGETHLLVPRPCGPRLPPGRAKEVVQSVLTTLRKQGINVPLPPDGVSLPQDRKNNNPGFPFWVWPNLGFDTLSLFFTREKPNGDFVGKGERGQIIDLIKRGGSFNGLEDELREAALDTCENIVDANIVDANQVKRGSINFRTRTFNNWNRLFIPENTVDVLEAYTQSVLEAIDCHVHFVDSWYYHTGKGEAHCATNVLHEPPSPESGNAERPPWWEAYPHVADADTTYNPNETRHTRENTAP